MTMPSASVNSSSSQSVIPSGSIGRSSSCLTSGVISSRQISTTSASKPPASFAAASSLESKVAVSISRPGLASITGSIISAPTLSS